MNKKFVALSFLYFQCLALRKSSFDRWDYLLVPIVQKGYVANISFL